jgi:uncharacterized lipoprotein YmbA
MRRRRFVSRCADGALRLGSSLALTAALASCLSAPPAVHLHSLMPNDAAMAVDARPRPTGSTPLVVVLDPVRMPSQVDQPQWLVQLPDGSLASLEQERWASPLRDEFQQALLETLIVRHGVVELRHSGNAVAGAASALRVAIDVRRFDSLPGQEARIEGSWTITGASLSSTSAPAPSHCEWLIRERAPGAASALAQAHRRAVARLADAIGAAMVALKRNQPATCPVAENVG